MADVSSVCALPDCTRPCFREDGILHAYCSRMHANEALDLGVRASIEASDTSSQICRVHGCSKNVFVDRETGLAHKFCSRRHSKLAKSQREEISQSVKDGAVRMVQEESGAVTFDDEAVVSKREWASTFETAQTCRLRGCSQKVHIDRETGRVHDFCSLRHSKLARSRREVLTENGKVTTACKVQGCFKTVYRDPSTGKESEYCSNKHYILGETLRSKECIRKGCSRSAWVEEDTGHLLSYCSSRCADAAGSFDFVGKESCSLPGCVGKKMVHPRTKEEMGYCCEDHRLRATQRSLGPVSEPFVDRTFRGGTTSATDFELSILTKMHPNYASVKEQFLQKWIKPDPAGGVSVLRILKVKSPEDVRRQYERYRQTVTNVARRFHGTSCSSFCTFFVDLRGGPCGELECNVCSICTNGFRLRNNVGRTARQTGINLRFGHGLYFSSVSGKANDYAKESEKTNRSGKLIRCMFMASVAVGRAFKTFESALDPSQCPPPGYDSVIGEVGPALNYDEVVVYREDAALPTFLIVYSLHY